MRLWRLPIHSYISKNKAKQAIIKGNQGDLRDSLCGLVHK